MEALMEGLVIGLLFVVAIGFGMLGHPAIYAMFFKKKRKSADHKDDRR